MNKKMVQNILGYESTDIKYLNRCIKELKKWNAPLDGWECIDVEDVREDDKDAPLSTCDVCGCDKVRYEHHMVHPEYFDIVKVGCICAGIMEGDILQAKERDRLMRNRSKRRKTFIKKAWKELPWGGYEKTYKGKNVLLVQTVSGYEVGVDAKKVSSYKGKPIKDTLTASYAAFNLVDSLSEVMGCAKRK